MDKVEFVRQKVCLRPLPRPRRPVQNYRDLAHEIILSEKKNGRE
jgi:hypothetical protein